MKSSYVDKNYLYTDPASYDQRFRNNIEKYLYSLWHPLLLKKIHEIIQPGDIVADLGCGTFIHTEHMSMAKHIYAVDVCQEMLDFGLPKIEQFKDKVTVLCQDATKTSIPSDSCDVVWIDGLSEFVNLENLFIEVNRILKKNGVFAILYHNRYNPFNFPVYIAYKLLGRKGKTYRHLFQFTRMSRKFGYSLREIQSKGVTFYAPNFIIPTLLPFWKVFDFLYTPLEKHFPLSHNILCVYRNEGKK